MTKKQVVIDIIVQHIGNSMATFGGGRGGDGFNPLARAMKDKPLMFALGVDVRAVVALVLNESDALTRNARRNAAKGKR